MSSWSVLDTDDGSPESRFLDFSSGEGTLIVEDPLPIAEEAVFLNTAAAKPTFGLA